MPIPSPFAIAKSSAQVGERSGMNSCMGDEEETKRISDKHSLSKNCNDSGTIYKEKRLAAAPIASLKKEEEKQMKKEEKKEDEEPYVDADKARGGVGRRGGISVLKQPISDPTSKGLGERSLILISYIFKFESIVKDPFLLQLISSFLILMHGWCARIASQGVLL
ncbi:Hypothetical predicted protein [Olea europaea subsp. europaea]|uniref:Uncharacterized protein n=1 Tax=Olea europaea subsp. europaea TaxID=158383 RepID=A0A8S0QXD3_OLEEU|nr:Hypothetical predicted protein [Olea europaea subsp. europaea]